MALASVLERQRLHWWMLVLEASLWLTLASLALRLLHFRHVARFLGPQERAGTARRTSEPAERERSRAQQIGRAVRRAARVLPWETLCLPQAMAAKGMLWRRGSRTTLHLGAKAGPAGGPISAHAWLMLGSFAVVGGAGDDGFAELVRFG